VTLLELFPAATWAWIVSPNLHYTIQFTWVAGFGGTIMLLSRSMPTEHILALLIQERERLNRAIDALQGPVKRRGRPPKNPLIGVLAATPKSSGARGWTAAQKKAQAARMKAYWRKKRSS
jgi:hypothetical protein